MINNAAQRINSYLGGSSIKQKNDSNFFFLHQNVSKYIQTQESGINFS